MTEYSPRAKELAMKMGLKAAEKLRKSGHDPDAIFAQFSPAVREEIKANRWEDWQRAMGVTNYPTNETWFFVDKSRESAIMSLEGLFENGADRVTITRRSEVDYEVEGEGEGEFR